MTLKTIIDQLTQFVKSQKALHWLMLFLFCMVSTYINYRLGLKGYLKSLSGTSAFMAYFCLYAVLTTGGYLFYSLTSRNFSYWKQPGFIFLLVLSFAIFAFRSSFFKHGALIERISSPEQAYINRLVYSDLFRFSYLVVPVVLIWFFSHKKEQPLYGFSSQHYQWHVYVILLLCMVPLIALASTQKDFLSYYPRSERLTSLHAPAYTIWLYEICYALDFAAIELFFRGFMIIAFIKYVGINSVLPTACFYLSIHYGKPFGEAVSSFFGGVVLGVISYHTKSIYGGIIIHVGIAWFMEIGGFIGNYLKR